MKKKNQLDRPELFINRELSWLEFNQRVLDEGMCSDLPLLERAKFMGITVSNLDEFFLIRVAGLNQQAQANLRKKDPSGMTPKQQLKAISKRAHEMMELHTHETKKLICLLAEQGLVIHRRNEWTLGQKQFLKQYFEAEILPILTPLALEDMQDKPLLPSLELNVAVTIKNNKNAEQPFESFVIPVPKVLNRWIEAPTEKGRCLVLLEDVIAQNVQSLYREKIITGVDFFRITRDADVAIQEDEASDLLSSIEEAILDRRRRAAVRLEISANAHSHLRKLLEELLEIHQQDIYEIDGLLDAQCMMSLAFRPGFDELKTDDWPPLEAIDIDPADDLWETIQDHDILLSHPFERFDPVIKLIELASEDPDVLAIKQTLYRTSGDSPVIKALETAAKNGKQVTVLVELKARFDEEQNVRWAKRLEDAGCYVLYGMAGLKTHSKALLIIRREKSRLRRYTHLSTGNYNDKTAKIYCDTGLITCDDQLTRDVAAYFNLLTGTSEPVGWTHLSISPTGMRGKFEELIEREIQTSTPEKPGLIMAKFNSLEDEGICKALYRASQAGVRILLNVRGICCLRPGIKGVSETITVTSIVDRYLEHARIFYFANGGHEEIYMGSADWMGRNLDKRMETLFPINHRKLKKRVIKMLQLYFSDNVKARVLKSDGTYKAVKTGKNTIQAQAALYEMTKKELQRQRKTTMKFRPVRHPQQ